MTSCSFMTQILTIHVIFTNADSTLLRHGVWERLWRPRLLFGRRLCAQKSHRGWVLSELVRAGSRACNQKCYYVDVFEQYNIWTVKHDKLAIWVQKLGGWQLFCLHPLQLRSDKFIFRHHCQLLPLQGGHTKGQRRQWLAMLVDCPTQLTLTSMLLNSYLSADQCVSWQIWWKPRKTREIIWSAHPLPLMSSWAKEWIAVTSYH